MKSNFLLATIFLAAALTPALPAAGGENGFFRGDSNSDTEVDIADAVTTLSFLFAGVPCACKEAADFDGNAILDITDPIGLLGFLFMGEPGPEPPFPACCPMADAPVLGCDRMVCAVSGSGGDPVWLWRHAGCMQCEPCTPIEDIVAALEASGITVLESKYGSDGMMHCLACTVCSSGRGYLVLVSPEDADALRGQGWGVPPTPR